MERTVELVRDAQAGDLEAFEELVRYESPAAFRLALAVLARPADAEDAMQEAWDRAWRSLPRLRDPEKWEAWFRQIVVRSAIDRARSSHRVKEVSLDEASDRASAPFEPGPDQRDDIARIMRSVGPEDRAILSLRFLLDLPVRQVAIEMKLPEGTVKSRLHRLLVRIQAESGSGNED